MKDLIFAKSNSEKSKKIKKCVIIKIVAKSKENNQKKDFWLCTHNLTDGTFVPSVKFI